MSRRNHKQDAAKGGPECTPAEVERLIEKDRLKDAFKQAKLCFRQHNSPENRRLLERTYLLRVKELAHGGMSNAAAEVARHFLEFGITDSDLLEDLVVLLPRVGMTNQAAVLSGRLKSPEAQARLSLRLVDRAVVHPEEVNNSTPDVNHGAERIRSALAALEAGEESKALELLQDIPRSSPFADWRFFVRGLAAYQRGDSDQAQANWDRLDPERSAMRIANVLRRATSVTKPDGKRDEADLSTLEVAVFGESVLGRIERLRKLLDKSNPRQFDWKQALAVIGSLRTGLGRIDPQLNQRLTEVLLEPVAAEAMELPLDVAKRLIRDFTRAVDPLPLDPTWERFWALMWERSGASLSGAMAHWKVYVTTFEQVTAVTQVERPRIQAMIWRHIARLFMQELNEGSPPYSYVDAASEEDLLAGAVEALEQSLKFDPLQRETHALALQFHEEWNQPEEGAAAARRLLEAFPDDVEALSKLIAFHTRKDEPEEVLKYSARGQAVKPLDSTFRDSEYWGWMTQTRHLALKGRFDEGRAALSRAEATNPEFAKDFQHLVRRAAFELKAGQNERAQEFLAQAQAQLSDLAPLWLIMSIQATRFKFPAKLSREYNDAWKKSSSKRKTGETAGQLVTILRPFLDAGIDYPQRDRHLSEVVEYLSKTTKATFTQDDLAKVCLFLLDCCDEQPLAIKMARRGLKLFPKCAVFPMLVAIGEMSRGPGFNFAYARQLFEQALALAEASNLPFEQKLATEVKRQLDTLNQVAESFGIFGPPDFDGASFGSGLPLDFLDFANSIDDDGEDYPDVNDFFFGPPPPAKSKAGKRQRR